ncbi:ATPase [Rhodanobacter panaciterrae]|uniref:ATPase n=1 Tax=Rhodanobacter panaciterrae TaxID=490572 RepID=A0ABQ2ZUH1_9GAMM|nr:MoxR family ATPase [Rhodanobacter panaciterrae]GGY26120.1 ATPase [Rhodanobacter panaciterrae]
MTTETLAAAPVTPLAPLSIAELGAHARALREQVAHAFIGQAVVFDQVLLALLAAGHVLIEGVPGLGKTLLVRALAASVGCSFGRIQFTPDLMPADVTGHAIYDPKTERFQIRRGPVFANLLLADEINRAPAKTQAALLESMQEGQVTIEGRRFALPAPFMVVATQNPIEQEGTYPLPEAQLDRFLIKVVIGYPSAEDESRMVASVVNGKVAADLDVSRVQPVMGQAELLALQQGVAAIRMDATVTDYAVRIVRTTREWPGVIGGAGPRGGLALARLARAQAVLDGRDFVTPDDVRAVALPALRHRLVLAPEALIERQRPDDVLTALLHKVPAPRQ